MTFELGEVHLKNRRLKQAVQALCLASPFCIVPRYKTYRCCVQASACGAAALRRFGIKARTVSCSVFARHANVAFHTSIGVGARYIYERINWKGTTQIPFEEWKATYCLNFPEENNPHEVIEAKLGGERALIDLTAEQVHEALERSPVDTTAFQTCFVGVNTGWPQFNNGPWTIEYGPPVQTKQEVERWRSHVRAYSNKGFEDDIYELMRLALHFKLDVEAFLQTLYRSDPNAVLQVIERANKQ